MGWENHAPGPGWLDEQAEAGRRLDKLARAGCDRVQLLALAQELGRAGTSRTTRSPNKATRRRWRAVANELDRVAGDLLSVIEEDPARWYAAKADGLFDPSKPRLASMARLVDADVPPNATELCLTDLPTRMRAFARFLSAECSVVLSQKPRSAADIEIEMVIHTIQRTGKPHFADLCELIFARTGREVGESLRKLAKRRGIWPPPRKLR